MGTEKGIGPYNLKTNKEIATRRAYTALIWAPILALTSCLGSAEKTASATSELNLLVGDAPIDSLASFQVDVIEIKLQRTDGSQTVNLLNGQRRLDLLGLSGSFSLVGIAEVEPGNFNGVSVAIDPTTVNAIGKDGINVPVTIVASTGSGDFGGVNLQLNDNEHDSLAIDIDLSRSLSDDGAGGLLFDINLISHEADGTEEMDEFRGLVESIDVAGFAFDAAIIDDDDNFGNIKVVIDLSAVMLDSSGNVVAAISDFMALLALGVEVEVDGQVSTNGKFAANRIRIEDDIEAVVELEGNIISYDLAANTIDILVEEIEKGEDLADSVLATLANPNLVQISWDINTKFNRPDGLSASTDLAVGMEIDVRFASFAAPAPFLASAIEIEDDDVEYEGVITLIAGDLASFNLELDSDDPSAGLAGGDVTVQLSGGAILYLDTEEEALLSADDLWVGMEVEIEGALTGPSGAMLISPSEIKVEPGELEATLDSVDLGGLSMSLSAVSEDDPFGGDTVSATDTYQLASGAVVEYDDNQLDLLGIASLIATNGSLSIAAQGVRNQSGVVMLYHLEIE